MKRRGSPARAAAASSASSPSSSLSRLPQPTKSDAAIEAYPVTDDATVTKKAPEADEDKDFRRWELNTNPLAATWNRMLMGILAVALLWATSLRTAGGRIVALHPASLRLSGHAQHQMSWFAPQLRTLNQCHPQSQCSSPASSSRRRGQKWATPCAAHRCRPSGRSQRYESVGMPHTCHNTHRCLNALTSGGNVLRRTGRVRRGRSVPAQGTLTLWPRQRRYLLHSSHFFGVLPQASKNLIALFTCVAGARRRQQEPQPGLDARRAGGDP
jgi:hypothetical protein